jgi:uncharacterized protein with ParB-like and HNH nuclease domain
MEQTQTIESLDLNLDKIFNDYYVVPSFQREYVWTEEQVEQLLQDIFDEYTDDGHKSEYFIGSLVVCPRPDGVLELIDGQQRMTTTYLFLCVVRDYLSEQKASLPERLTAQIKSSSIDEDGNDVPRFHVQLMYNDSHELLAKIAQAKVNIEEIPPETVSVTNIANAYKVIKTFVTSEFGDDTAAVKKFYAYVINRVKLVRIKTQSVAHALKVFETINDRGVGLDAMDLLKNLMFINATESQFENLKNSWKLLVDTLYSAKEKPLRFLRYFIFANFDVDRLKEDQIYTWFTKNKNLCGYEKDPIGFVKWLNESARAYTNFSLGKNADGTANQYLANMRHMSGAARQHLILLLTGMKLHKDVFTELCRQLENLFFVYIITREPTKEFERRFAVWATDLNKVTSSEDLQKFLDDRFVPAKRNLASRYNLAFRQLQTSSIQKYRMRYILGKLTQYVDSIAYAQTVSDLDKYLQSTVHIEHILPQTPSQAVLDDFDMPDEITTYICRLGNLVLLEKPINTSLSNGLFPAKKPAYAKSQFLLTRSIAENLAVGNQTSINRAINGLEVFTTWQSKDIEKRQEILTNLANKVWDMPS